MATRELQENIEAFEQMRMPLGEHHMRKSVGFHNGQLFGAFDTFHNATREAVKRPDVGN